MNKQNMHTTKWNGICTYKFAAPFGPTFEPDCCVKLIVPSGFVLLELLVNDVWLCPAVGNAGAAPGN